MYAGRAGSSSSFRRRLATFAGPRSAALEILPPLVRYEDQGRLAPSTIAIMRSKKALAGQRFDFDDQPVGYDPRAAGDCVAVAAAVADNGRAFAGDGWCNLSLPSMLPPG